VKLHVRFRYEQSELGNLTPATLLFQTRTAAVCDLLMVCEVKVFFITLSVGGSG